MKNKAVSILLILLALLLPSGCWDRRELEEQAYVVAVGIDTTDDPEYNIYTYQIVIPSKLIGGGEGGAGGAEGGKSHFETSIRARTMFTAQDTLQATVSRRITLLQCRALLVSEAVARRGMLPAIRVLTRTPELRRTLLLAVVPGKAMDLLNKVEPKLQDNLNKYYEELTFANEYTGFTTISTINTLAKAVESGGEDAVITLTALKGGTLDETVSNAQAGELPRAKGENQEFLGVAVFHNDKMVGKLGKLETEVLNMLNGDWHVGPYTIKDPMEPQFDLGLFLYENRRPELDVDTATDPVTVNIMLRMNARLVSQFGKTDYTLAENKTRLEQALKQTVEERCQRLVERAQGEFKADVFKIGNRAVKKQFLTWPEWRDFDWEEKFPQADIRVSAEIQVMWFGTQRAPTEVIH